MGGTPGFGTVLFGLVQQRTHSCRLSILALVAFFVVGAILLARVDVRAGIRAAGDPEPLIV